MPERDGYIAGVPCWIDTSQPDPEAAIDFYGALFGWEFENAMPPDAPGKYYIARIRGGDVAAVSSQSEGGPPTPVWNTYVWVDSADKTASKVEDAGGQIIAAPFEVMGAGRMAVLADPDGAAFCVWQANEHRGARIVNEHGSLNFNNLHTRDPERAKRFYGFVFGWETLPMGQAEAWRLPGYGDFLEQSDPGLRDRMAATGAPEGFEDVVASLVPLPVERAETPAHWSVTFAVDNADAVAERAVELGGEIVAPPADAPWVRTAVISDPQGATFIASQFVPENKDRANQSDPLVHAA
jgi:uncharacterized protein